MIGNRIGDSAKDSVLAGGGFLGAIGVSACCLLPLVLALAGISSTWIGSLVKLAPYQPAFLGVAVLSVGTGLWRAYRADPSHCEGPQCNAVKSRPVTKAVLWASAALILIGGTTEWWARYLT